MLDLTKMSPADAQHNLTVLAWLNEHQDELKTLAAKNPDDESTLSMAGIVAAGGFNSWRTGNRKNMMNVSSMRLVPMIISVFSDDISLAEVPDPIVALIMGENTVYPTHEDNTDADPIAICRVYGIDPEDAAWTSHDFYTEL